jgi:hypothetical protein
MGKIENGHGQESHEKIKSASLARRPVFLIDHIRDRERDQTAVGLEQGVRERVYPDGVQDIVELRESTRNRQKSYQPHKSDRGPVHSFFDLIEPVLRKIEAVGDIG